MIRIDHIALWTEDIERLVDFYAKYFNATAGQRYVNPAKGFESRFVSFARGARLEVMRSTTVEAAKHAPETLDGPRRTGDGYYESLVLDPDGNRIEITA
jgi:lactoylglutathione lyase